jgi:hypothetical protein
MLINYLQIVSTIMSFNIDFNIFKDVTETTANPIKQEIYSLDCFLVSMNESGSIPVEYLRVLWSFIIPIFYLII